MAIGGLWFTLARLRIQPLGFGDTIVLLTAVHFHFAGFAAPILAGLAGRTLDRSGSARRVFQFSAVGIVAGTPLVAAGITFSPVLALFGALVISVGLCLLAVVVLGWVVPSFRSAWVRFLFGVSSVSSPYVVANRPAVIGR